MTIKSKLIQIAAFALLAGCGETQPQGEAVVSASLSKAYLFEEAVSAWKNSTETFTTEELHAMTLRKLAFSIKGSPLSFAELAALKKHKGTVPDKMVAAWRKTPTHVARIDRAMRDMANYVVKSDPGTGAILGGTLLEETTSGSGVYTYWHRNERCDESESVTFDASDVWFLDSGTIKVCSVDLDRTVGSSWHWITEYLLDPYGQRRITRAGICGKHLLNCRLGVRFAYNDTAWQQLQDEIPRRMHHYYESGGSFDDAFLGREGYENRYSAWRKITQDGALLENRLSPEKVLEFLKSIPLDKYVPVTWPEELTETVGIINSTTYMHYYNNSARSKASGIVADFLCDMPWGSMPTSSTELVNKHVDQVFKAPFKQQPCTFCHTAMDQLATAMQGYGYAGEPHPYMPKLEENPRNYPSRPADYQAGELFGKLVQGPAGIAAVLKTLPRYRQCNAEKMARALTGFAWDKFDDATKNRLIKAGSSSIKDFADAVVQEIVRTSPLQ